LLSVKTYVRYSKALHFQQPAIENRKLGPLPQIYADQFGWEEMVATVARVYNALSADDRAKTAIFAQNYGQAGAIDFFGPKFGLPKAISGHQNYFFWGPREFTDENKTNYGNKSKKIPAIVSSRLSQSILTMDFELCRTSLKLCGRRDYEKSLSGR
jgi:hypothetical protein